MLPQLRELEQRYPESVAVVGVHSGKYVAERDTARIRDASVRLGATHPVLNDRQFRVWRAYAVRAWPPLVAIDPKGSVVGMSAGEFTADAELSFHATDPNRFFDSRIPHPEMTGGRQQVVVADATSRLMGQTPSVTSTASP